MGLAGVVLGACGSGPGAAAPQPSSSTPQALTPSCPAVAGANHWPSNVPADIPVPPSTHVLSDQRTTEGLVLVRFETSSGLRDGILFVLDAFPRAGYVMGRGDAEVSEADAPFVKNDSSVRGAMRLVVVGPCRTSWLLAVARTQFGVGPVVPTFRPTSTSSPLPFG